MTTIDAAAAWRLHKSVMLAVFAAFMGIGLGGCETGTSLFASNGDPGVSASLANTAPPPAVSQTPKIAIAPVIGAPDTVAKQLETQLTTLIESRQITVAKPPADKAEYTLRGYVVSAREKTRTKVSYIWDVTDQTGKRVHRITGEEVVTGTQSKDPWAAVNAQVIDTIAVKTSGSLASWLPTQAQPAVVAAATPAAAPGATASLQSPAPAYAPPAGSSAPSTQTTGSIGRPAGPVNAMVPSVTGAPGDGSVALTGALQRELTKSGIALTDRPGAQTYKVEGKVIVGEGKDGKQPIQIDWNVTDPEGKKLGTVSQKNEIPQGSLDGAWGKTADAAASAAAQGILKLLPQTRTN